MLEGGIISENPDERPDVRIPCDAAWDSTDVPLLEELLAEYPGIYEEALRNIDEIKYWEEKEPFRPYVNAEEANQINGQFNIGYTNGFPVGLDPLAFTRGLFICGETGSGKSYPILRLTDQILSIPKMKNEW